MAEVELPEVDGWPCPYGDDVESGQQPLRDSCGKRLTRALFWETRNAKGEYDNPIYTLKERDHRDLPSARRIYLECADPTEWVAAHVLLGSWEHWHRLLSCPWFKEHIREWRDALETKMRSEALRQIANTSRGATPQSFAAARFLAEKGWEPKKTGRPAKADKERAIRMDALLGDEVADDLARIQSNPSETVN